jgi:uncharacterized membrane protein (UPF0127 family)
MKIKLIAIVVAVAALFLIAYTMDVKKEVVIVNDVGEEVKVKVEIADTLKKRTVGLMDRQSLDEDSGMLFVFDLEAKHSFWMKNTLIPLDIIFIDSNNKIVDIKHNFEPCKKIICDTYASAEVAKYALEVNGGFSEKNNIRVNNTVLLDGI